MRHCRLGRWPILVTLVLGLGVIREPVAAQATPDAARQQSADAIPGNQRIQPEELNAGLQSRQERPLIFQVGSRILYDEAHIPGADYEGPASRPAGIDALRNRVAKLPRNQAIVIYCGCCPWDRCPNIAPAWRLLHAMGFTSVKALYIATNFGSDWVSRGYRVEKTQ